MPHGQSFDRLAADYDRFASLEPGRIRGWLEKQLPARGHRALDAGCGAGCHTQALAERFDEVVGVDVSEKAALLHLRGLVSPGGIAILIDNVASRPTPPRWVHVLGAVRNIPSDARRLGWRQARWLMQFRTSACWLDHLASDRYLSRQAFELQYGTIFPGGLFQNLAYAHALVWTKKNPATAARGSEVRREP